jgi:hypothetical protein
MAVTQAMMAVTQAMMAVTQAEGKNRCAFNSHHAFYLFISIILRYLILDAKSLFRKFDVLIQ